MEFPSFTGFSNGETHRARGKQPSRRQSETTRVLSANTGEFRPRTLGPTRHRSLIIIYLSGDRSDYTVRRPPCVLDNYSMHILTIRPWSGPLNRPAAAALIVLQMYIVADDNAIKAKGNVTAGRTENENSISPVLRDTSRY